MMAIFNKVIRCLSLVFITCQGHAAPLFADSEKIDGMSLTERPPLQVVEACLHSIGYSLSDTCKEHSALYDVPDRNLEEEDFEDEDTSFYIKNGISALICVILAALAAGLTMGLVSQELIDLKIKEAAGDAVEKKQARAVIPLIRDHHRMLVTLLLLNAMANEALPLFLDKLVPGYVAVILSVTLVLFFGEIIPSAIFSGPNKLAIASKLAPLVQVLLWLFCPLAWPIAKILDNVLHEDEDGLMQKYDRRELKALVRLQHANLDSTNAVSQRFVKHIDTVNMVEGALEMNVTTAKEVMVPINDVFSIPRDMILDEDNILEIYRAGFSRVPVHEPGNKCCIWGIFRSRQLIVMNSSERRELSSLQLVKPHCISPQMNMLSVINLLQEGKKANKGGLLAIICEDPHVAELALDKDEHIPESAGILGILTLENCIEALIKEEIYDEYDTAEKVSMERARWAVDKWFSFVEKKRKEKQDIAEKEEAERLQEVVNESTELLQSLLPP